MRSPSLDLAAFTGIPAPVATARELRKAGMLAVNAWGLKVALFHGEGQPRAYIDACPHLGMPLTLGDAEGDRVTCRYHGWAFSQRDGAVLEQPTSRKKLPCRLRRVGALVAGGIVFVWRGDPDASSAARASLPGDLPEDLCILRVRFQCPFYLALFSSVDYAHFPFHSGYRPLYALYRRVRGSEHRPGTPFATKLIDEDEHRIILRIESAGRTIRMYATAAEMLDDGGVSRFITFAQPVGPARTIYWECYRPHTGSRIGDSAARLFFRNVNGRFIRYQDQPWVRVSAPNFVSGDNIHLVENDLPLGAHLRKFVWPRLA